MAREGISHPNSSSTNLKLSAALLNLCLAETASPSTQQVNVTSSKDTTAEREFRKDGFACMDCSLVISHHREEYMV